MALVKGGVSVSFMALYDSQNTDDAIIVSQINSGSKSLKYSSLY